MSHLPGLGQAATHLHVFKHHPPLGRHVAGLMQAAIGPSDALSPAECELVGAYVSALNGCGYCRVTHAEAAAVGGIGPEALAPLAAGQPPAYGGPRWEPVFRHVAALAREPKSVSRGHVAAMLDAGWSEDGIVQVNAVVCALSVLNRLVEGLGLEAHDELLRGFGRHVAAPGYA